MKITITYEKWTVPDYRNGETEKDSQLKKLELESNILKTERFSVGMDDDEVIDALNLIKSILKGAIEKEEENKEKELNNGR